MDSGEINRPKNWLESLNYAIEGVIYAFKTQRHVRYHYVIAAAALFLSLFLELPVIEFVLFAMAVIILLFAEMMNHRKAFAGGVRLPEHMVFQAGGGT